MQYTNLGTYIRDRCRARGLPLVEASLRMNFSRSYLPSIAKGTFNPSRERCIQIAEFFGDPPSTILQLAGFFIPETDVQQHEEIARIAATLPHSDCQLLLEITHILKERSDRRRATQRELRLVAEQKIDYETNET